MSKYRYKIAIAIETDETLDKETLANLANAMQVQTETVEEESGIRIYSDLTYDAADGTCLCRQFVATGRCEHQDELAASRKVEDFLDRSKL